MTDHALIIKEIYYGKKNYLDLLLIGDEQEDMIDRYLDRSRLFIGFCKGNPVSCIAATEDEPSRSVEIMNLAVVPGSRKQGIGRKMLIHVESLFPGYKILLGTGETPSTLRFYMNCGYSYSHMIPDFFTGNYDHPIVEEGVVLRDMLYLCKQLPTFQSGSDSRGQSSQEEFILK